MYLKKQLLLIYGAVAIPFLGLQANTVNVALHKPVTASSQQEAFPASYVTDGVISRKSSWMSANDARPPHTLHINLERYYDINRIVIYTGIPDSEQTVQEKGKAPGFWCVKNFKIQYWDDANWTDLPNTECTENRLDKLEFTFRPELTTFRIQLVSTDGEPIRINEFEVYGKEKTNMPVPVTTGEATQKIDQPLDKEMQVTVHKNVIGKSMKYVAYNQGYYLPGSNISGWLEYANVNSLRVWTSLDDYVPQSAVLNDKKLSTLEGFEAYKYELRSHPEHNRFIRWKPITEQCENICFSTNSMVFEYVLKELKRLNIEAVIQINSTDFDGTWSNKWKQWQRYYALAFYAAKTGDVTMYAMHNEPNHRHAGPMKIEQYVEAMKIVSDAIYCAVQDVNKQYGKHLKSRFVSPVTAGSNANWWAEVVKNLRIDYRGLPLNRDLLDIFSTHSYNLPAAGYASKVSDIRKIIVENHPLKQSLPIVYTETGRWMNAYLIDKEETMDSPSLFTEWAGEYTNNTLNQGYGMWAFKFANTTSATYPRGIKSGHHFIWQGKRVVEDTYNNVASGKNTMDLTSSHPVPVKVITDGDKTDASMWISPDTDAKKCLEINLKKDYTLGGAVVYTGSAYGVYTAPDRVKDFRLQYWDNTQWTDIKETIEENARYAQSFFLFDTPVTTSKVRFVAMDKGSIKVREIKLFDAESVKDIPSSYDVSGIQRTGEVVRLFAKGFKDERPLLHTVKSVADQDVDAITCFNPEEMRYYVWLVQRKLSSNHLTLDMKSLELPTGTKVIAEEVSANAYGEVVWVKEIPADGQLSFELPNQSVILLTIPICSGQLHTLTATADATVKAGANKEKNFGKTKTMNVEMNASRINSNQVSYIKFDLSGIDQSQMNAAILQVYGSSSAKSPYRFHVYALDNSNWNEYTLNWNNAPNLDKEQVRVTDVGRTAHVAGEIAMNETGSYHQLDVTSLIRKCRQPEITFVLIREVRQLGDDADNGKSCQLGTKESENKPALCVW
ncbi:DNRLRE domain-containing protein [Bacteroides sp. 51]|uniref:DNRLRE domain-containing protein n=1 Tax=Bacteroides sp. 51 TaxID=2302938 RepID=UPI0013D45109|nr:DNRLRE domain-containing protein [Bacteroides sp. 51]NDV83626.1 carbohydrate-binding protein [Bacteroides sp. 51]